MLTGMADTRHKETTMTTTMTPTGRGWAYACALLGGAVSVAANWAHSYLSLTSWRLRRTGPESLHESMRLQQMYLWATTIMAFPVLGLITNHAFYGAATFGAAATLTLAGWFIAGSFIEGFRAGEKHGAAVETERQEAEHRQREINLRPCDLSHDLQWCPPGEGFVYILQFDTGVVKVGQTIYPQVRLGKHRRDAAALNVAITGYWLSPPHMNYLDNEVALIDFCTQRHERAKQEYFYDAKLAAVRAFACGLTYYSNTAVAR